ncbi:Hypothetical protein AJF4211_003690 [Avibacterium paragallinarum JF4211]|nr:Hypothetical protein AJF4211_003580 [Avibacterium paragallinarum JF4211]CDF98626.1 Hypothetical protein AJF4211_003690 [Avibacterium paragallinarum JF4211]
MYETPPDHKIRIKKYRTLNAVHSALGQGVLSTVSGIVK